MSNIKWITPQLCALLMDIVIGLLSTILIKIIFHDHLRPKGAIHKPCGQIFGCISNVEKWLFGYSPPPHWAKMSLNIPRILFYVKLHYFQNSKIWPFFETTKSGGFKIDIFFKNWLILGNYMAIFPKKPLDFGPKMRFLECNFS